MTDVRTHLMTTRPISCPCCNPVYGVFTFEEMKLILPTLTLCDASDPHCRGDILHVTAVAEELSHAG